MVNIKTVASDSIYASATKEYMAVATQYTDAAITSAIPSLLLIIAGLFFGAVINALIAEAKLKIVYSATVILIMTASIDKKEFVHWQVTQHQ